jgi:hypothetical protein
VFGLAWFAQPSFLCGGNKVFERIEGESGFLDCLEVNQLRMESNSGFLGCLEVNQLRMLGRKRVERGRQIRGCFDWISVAGVLEGLVKMDDSLGMSELEKRGVY